MSDPEHDQAAETLLGYAGRRASRELLATVLVAPFVARHNDADLTDERRTQVMKASILGALRIADTIIKMSEENPPR